MSDSSDEWINGKKWIEYKIDYLKRHITHTMHREAVWKLQNFHKGPLKIMLTESKKDKRTEKGNEFEAKIKSRSNKGVNEMLAEMNKT